MPKFRNREEYERWKNDKMQNAEHAPVSPMEMTSDVPEEEKSKKGLFIILAVLIGITLASVFAYKQFSEGKVTWTETSYTNRKHNFRIDIPEGWSTYEFPADVKAAISAGTAPGTKTLFTLSPNNSRNAVYGLMDMHKVLKPDNPNVQGRINAEINKARNLFKNQGFKIRKFDKTISGLTAIFVRAQRYKTVFITGILLQAPDNTIMFQFFNSDGSYEREFWKSAESLKFL
jgi:hypothetical protein